MTNTEANAILHVSDTSAWVAYYRSQESERSDALFQDPFAKVLVAEKYKKFESMNTEVTKWTRWTVVMRTYIIDQMIWDLKSKGVNTFINLGAGLDSRPYRMNLGHSVNWIEVDFPHIIAYKTETLKNYAPKCNLQTVALDLANREQRISFLSDCAQKYSKIAVLTEGVLPYLTQEQVSELSDDLTTFSSFKYWICEYISPQSYKYLKSPKRMKMMKNAPFQFYPPDWMYFFKQRGWQLSEEKYFTETSEQLKRPTPMPKFFKIIEFFIGPKKAQSFKRMSGFLLWERSS